jgi:similar to stage IV sporulation protein
MFIKIILSYLCGYIRISVEGYYIERFINICKTKKITIWNLKRNKDIQLYLNVRISEFKKLREIAKKTRCKIKIKNKKGLPFFIHKYKKRKIFLVLLIIVILLIGLSSNFVWNVDITEENEQKLENIEQDLEEARIKNRYIKIKNKYKRNYKQDKIKKK